MDMKKILILLITISGISTPHISLFGLHGGNIGYNRTGYNNDGFTYPYDGGYFFNFGYGKLYTANSYLSQHRINSRNYLSRNRK